MDTNKVVIWICIGLIILLTLIFFFYFVRRTDGIVNFIIYILFPIFVISFLLGMALILQLIVKLNEKLDNNLKNFDGINKKIDVNNVAIKESIDNIDGFLKIVDDTLILQEVDSHGHTSDYRYNPKTFDPITEIPEDTNKDLEELNENQKDIAIEIKEISEDAKIIPETSPENKEESVK